MGYGDSVGSGYEVRAERGGGGWKEVRAEGVNAYSDKSASRNII